jgi:hypothetical protein
MNLYLNKEQENFFRELFDNPNLQTVSHNENAEEFIEQFRMKLNKKKINTKEKLPSAEIVDINGNTLFLSPREDNGAIIIRVNKEDFGKNPCGRFKYDWNIETSIQLINYLHEYAIFTGDDQYEVYNKYYGEEFNIFKDGVERSITLSFSRLSFVCYTNDVNDDDWTFLSPIRVKETLKMMVAYIFLTENTKKHFDKLHPDIQNMYADWSEKQKQENTNN